MMRALLGQQLHCHPNIHNLWHRRKPTKIIPQKTISEAIRITSNKEKVKIIIDKNQVVFETSQNELTSRLIEGSYPDYTNFVPTNFKSEVVLNREEFIKTIRLVSLLSSRINDIKLSINNNDKKSDIKIYASDPDLGENSSLLSADLEGEDIDISFNWRYLLEGLQQIKGNKITMKFTEETKPVLIKSADDSSYIYIVMPIRV